MVIKKDTIRVIHNVNNVKANCDIDELTEVIFHYIYIPFYLTVSTWHIRQITVNGYQTGSSVEARVYLTCNLQLK